MLKRVGFILFGALMCAGFAVPAMAAVLQIDVATGALTGAKKVEIGTRLYNVSFVDGSCPDLFRGCDSNRDFDFSGVPNVNALVAAAALRDQVFVDGPQGNFDSDPGLTFGCNGAPCMTLIPSGLSPDPSDSLMRSGAFINIAGASVDLIGLATYDVSVDTSGILSVAPGLIDITDPSGTTSPWIGEVNYATFSEVPLPAPALLLLGGIVGLAGLRRRPT